MVELKNENGCVVMLEGKREEQYMEWMAKVEADPESAASEWIKRMEQMGTKASMRSAMTMRKVLGGESWQAGSRNLKDAIQFVVSNALMKGVFKMGVEDIAKTMCDECGQVFFEAVTECPHCGAEVVSEEYTSGGHARKFGRLLGTVQIALIDLNAIIEWLQKAEMPPDEYTITQTMKWLNETRDKLNKGIQEAQEKSASKEDSLDFTDMQS